MPRVIAPKKLLGMATKGDGLAPRRVLGQDLSASELKRFAELVKMCTAACRSPPLQSSASNTISLRTAPFRLVVDDPPVHVCDNFLAPDECEALIAAGESLLKPSSTSSADSSLFKVAASGPRRSSSSAMLDDRDPACAPLLKKIAALTGYSAAGGHLEHVQISRYLPGEEYSEHTDAVEVSATEASRAFMARGGQRTCTVLCYLTDVNAGGETVFSRLDYRCVPRAGRCLVFFPGRTDGTCDARMVHAALPPEQTSKWVAQVWVRQFADPLRTLEPPRWPSGCHSNADLYRLAVTGGEEQALTLYYFGAMS